MAFAFKEGHSTLNKENLCCIHEPLNLMIACGACDVMKSHIALSWIE